MTTPKLDILDALPHRPPFRFLSRVLDIHCGEQASAIWTITGDEPFFEGHFPDRPIVPGVLITEALAQLSGLVALPAAQGAGPDLSATGHAGTGKLAHVEIRFRESVPPPAEIHLTSRLARVFESLHQFEVAARTDSHRVASGTLTLSLPAAPEAAR